MKNFWKEMEGIETQISGETQENLAGILEKAEETKEVVASTGITTEVKEKNLFGFVSQVEVEKKPDVSKINGQIREIKNAINEHNDNAREKKEFEKELRAEGFEPVAIVTENFFSKACKESGLIRLERMLSDGRVAVANFFSGDSNLVTVVFHAILSLAIASMLFGLGAQIVGKFPMENAVIALAFAVSFWFFSKKLFDARNGWHVLGMGFVSSVILALGTLAFDGWPLGSGNILVSAVIAAGMILISTLGCIIYDTVDFFKDFSRFIARLIVKTGLYFLPESALVKLVFPDGTDDRNRGNYVTLRFKVTPPESFLQKVEKMHRSGKNLMIAAHYKTIMLDRKEMGLAIGKQIDSVNLPTFKLDPILYCQKGRHVAILDSFGVIPEEEKVLKKVQEDWRRMVIIPESITNNLDIHFE